MVNVYAPTRDKPTEQSELIQRLQCMLGSLDYENLIVGGDLNTTLNPELDKKGG